MKEARFALKQAMSEPEMFKAFYEVSKDTANIDK